MGLEPEVISDNEEMRSWSRNQRRNGETIALVPTMGFLLQGHLSLLEEGKKHAGVVVVSIYVNPGQFAPGEDLSRYPSDFEGDSPNSGRWDASMWFFVIATFTIPPPKEWSRRKPEKMGWKEGRRRCLVWKRTGRWATRLGLEWRNWRRISVGGVGLCFSEV